MSEVIKRLNRKIRNLQQILADGIPDADRKTLEKQLERLQNQYDELTNIPPKTPNQNTTKPTVNKVKPVHSGRFRKDVDPVLLCKLKNKGYTDKEIAKKLGISYDTVHHMKNYYLERIYTVRSEFRKVKEG